MIRVIIADDHHVVRQGIRSLLDDVEDIDVVAEAADGQEAIQRALQHLPDVLVMDVSMTPINGILATEELRKRNMATQVVILSVHASKTMVREALAAGALGYVLKQSVASELILAVRSASQGKLYLCERTQTLMQGLDDEDDDNAYAQLTPRERQVLQLIAEGHTNAEMAELLFLSVKTIEKHRASLIEKLGTRDVASLVRVAIRHGLITLNS